MASAALISLSHTLEQIPQPVHQITSLKESVSSLLVILEDFSQKSSLSISDLEGQIRDTSYEAEDIIEPHLSRKVFSRSISCGVISCFWEMISVLRNGELFQGLEGVMDKFDSILGALSEMKEVKVEDLQPRNSSTAGPSRFVDSDECNPVGLDDDLWEIKDRLTGSTSKLDIISIVGMGGIGKTTLARNLYNDALIEEKFQIRAWIVVSQRYHVQEMLMGLLDSTKQVGGDLNKKNIQELSELLHKSLKSRRYLIVMDDVWDTKAWDDVRLYFPEDNNGSRVILTTRLLDVATYSHSYIHRMNLLNPGTSWKLLREKVFGDDQCPSRLKIIGEQIAQSCEGLPLAIIVIGGLLSKGSRTEDYWEYIAENVNSAVSGNDDDRFKKILSLSYNSLPHHLRTCFLHVGVFPEDHEIFVSQLTMMWVAEGFIKPLAPKSLEDVAEDYLKDLIDRSLIFVRKRNHDGGIKTCTIHDMLRELCVKKAQDEKFLQIMKSDLGDFPSNILGPRRVSIHSNILDRLTDVRDMSIRSVLYYCKGDSNNQLLSFTMCFRLLRVLDALGIIFYEFPIQILGLVQLRYLAFIYRGKTKFPASISKLQNLQTLIVYRGEFSPFIETLYLPSTIWEMPQLRHLLFDGSFIPYPYLAQIIGKDCVALKNLQTLSGIKNFRFSRKVFEIMPNLKKLGISFFYDKHIEWSAYELNNFVHLDQLETLKCLFFLEHNQAEKPLSINLAFPRNLKKLTLSGCRISWDKMTVVGSLPKLEVLKLKNMAFEGSIWKPNEEEFRKLKFLLIYKSLLKQWWASNEHFPLLQHLVLVYCPILEVIPSEIGDIPTLQSIELYECSTSAVDSAKQIQDEQQSYDNTIRVRIGSIRDYNFSRLNTSLRKAQAQGAAWYG